MNLQLTPVGTKFENVKTRDIWEVKWVGNKTMIFSIQGARVTMTMYDIAQMAKQGTLKHIK